MVLSHCNVSSPVTGAAIEHCEMLENWESCPDKNVGWCLLCDGPIRSAQDLIPNTSTHNCQEGLKLESRLR